MRPLAKLALFAVILAGAFGGGAALGAALPDLGPARRPSSSTAVSIRDHV